MALKDSFINLNKALRTTLQNVPAVVDTLIRGFDEIGDAADEQSTYSTDERVVGKWIDGSDLYEKIISAGALLNNSEKTVDTGVTGIKEMVEISGVSINGTNNSTVPLPYVYPSGDISIYYNGTSIIIKTTTDRTSYTTTYVKIRYTKTAANRAPEDDTRNGDDVKTVEEPAEELKK